MIGVSRRILNPLCNQGLSKEKPMHLKYEYMFCFNATDTSSVLAAFMHGRRGLSVDLGGGQGDNVGGTCG